MILDTVYTILETLLLEELKTNFVPTGDLKKLQHVDVYNDQFANEDIEKAFQYPAALIQFSDITWSTKSQGIQVGELIIRFHIGQKIMADTKAGAKFQDKGLTRFEYLEVFHNVVQGFSGACFSSLDRITTLLDEAHTNKIVDVMEYVTTLTDASADIKKDLVEATQPVDLNVKKGSPPAIVPVPSPFHLPC